MSKTPPLPFMQGSLDVFCAPYAVINAFRRLYGMRRKLAKQWLDDLLLDLAATPARLRDWLSQKDDGMAMVDLLLELGTRTWPCRTSAPFADHPGLSVDFFQKGCESLLDGKDAMLVFCFEVYLTPDSPPVLTHWTAAYAAQSEGLALYDGGAGMPNPIEIISWKDICLLPSELGAERRIRIRPETCRLVRKLCAQTCSEVRPDRPDRPDSPALAQDSKKNKEEARPASLPAAAPEPA